MFWLKKKKLKISKVLEKRKNYDNRHKNSQNLFNQHESWFHTKLLHIFDKGSQPFSLLKLQNLHPIS
jgi:hypothetical protein